MVHMFHEMDVETGVDLDRLIQTAQMIQNWFPQPLPGMVMKAGKTSALTD